MIKITIMIESPVNFDELATPLPHVLGPKYDRQRPRNSEKFRIGVSQGDLSHDL
jgi:hypothetical protein